VKKLYKWLWRKAGTLMTQASAEFEYFNDKRYGNTNIHKASIAYLWYERYKKVCHWANSKFE
jgi:hypothetical protein